MKRIFERAGEACETKNRIQGKKKIGVVGTGSGVGTTFVAAAIAFYASRKQPKHFAAYVQMDGGTGKEKRKTNVYDALGMDRRFLGREFTDFFALLEQGRAIRGIRNLDDQINWVLRPPTDYARFGRNAQFCTEIHKERNSADVMRTQGETIQLLRLCGAVSGNPVICDFGNGTSCEELFEDMDTMVLVIDPMPSKLLGAAALFDRLRQMKFCGHDVVFVLNKENNGINRKELRDFLGRAADFTIPMLEEAEFYRAEYNCEIPAARRSIREKTETVFSELLSRVLTQ